MGEHPKQTGEYRPLAFVKCGDDWVRSDTITAVQVEWRSVGRTDETYVVKVRSSAFGSARIHGEHHGKALAEEAAEALVRLLCRAVLFGSSASEQGEPT